MAMVEAHRVVRRSSLTIVNSYVEMGIFCCFFERVEDDNHEPIRCGSIQRERQGKAMPAGFNLLLLLQNSMGVGMVAHTAWVRGHAVSSIGVR